MSKLKKPTSDEMAQRARELRRAIARGEAIEGRPSLYRGKNRSKPIQVYLTDDGIGALERGCRRTGLSRPDYIEKLVIADDTWARKTKAGIRAYQQQKAEPAPAVQGTG